MSVHTILELECFFAAFSGSQSPDGLQAVDGLPESHYSLWWCDGGTTLTVTTLIHDLI